MFSTFIHYHTKCSHFKIHVIALLLYCHVIWSLSKKFMIYKMCEAKL